MIGVFDAHARQMLNLWSDDWPNLKSFHRPLLALECLHQIVRGERFVCERWPLRLGRGRAHLEIEDLPATVQQTIARVASGVAWRQIMEMDDGFELCGQNADGQALWAYMSTEGRLIHMGQDRRRGETTKTPAFSPALLERIGSDGHTRWATQRVCDEAHLRCILWLAGEWNARTSYFFDPMRRAVLVEKGFSDGVVALEAMQSFVGFEQFDVAEFERRIKRGCGHSHPGGLPVNSKHSILGESTSGEFHELVLACDIEGMKLALGAGADSYAVDRNGYTPLQIAAWFGKTSSLRFLLTLPVDLGRSATNGWSPLILALRYSRTEEATLLIDAGVDVDMPQPIGGVTPLMLAANFGNWPIVQALLQRGADPRPVDSNGADALTQAGKAMAASPSKQDEYAAVIHALEAALRGPAEI